MGIKTVQFTDVIDHNDFIFNVGLPASMIGMVSLTFYADSRLQQPIMPTQGTATIQISEDGFNWGDITNGVINYPLVDNKYDRPNFVGYAGQIKLNLHDISGGVHFVLRVHLQ